MKKLKWLVLTMLAGCGGGEDELNEQEIGQAEQGITVRFSATKTYGVSGGDRRECTLATGAETIYVCLVPKKRQLKYKFTGPADSTYPFDWRYNWTRAVQNLKLTLDNYGQTPTDWSFTETTGTADITITTGTCPGDANTSETISTYVCTSFTDGANLSESLAGSYRLWATMKVTVDLTKIAIRDNGDITDAHYIMEHGTFAAAQQAIGMGMLPLRNAAPTILWSENFVRHNTPGLSPYDFAEWSPGGLCKARTYATNDLSAFIKGAGANCPE
jgi:hypothetical protein